MPRSRADIQAEISTLTAERDANVAIRSKADKLQREATKRLNDLTKELLAVVMAEQAAPPAQTRARRTKDVDSRAAYNADAADANAEAQAEASVA